MIFVQLAVGVGRDGRRRQRRIFVHQLLAFLVAERDEPHLVLRLELAERGDRQACREGEAVEPAIGELRGHVAAGTVGDGPVHTEVDRKSTRMKYSHYCASRMATSA